MAEKQWVKMKVRYCDHAECEVALESEQVLPAEHLPEQPARIIAHRCSRGVECSLLKDPTCVWAGTNPGFDPFAE
jgi:hypothetical protein